MSYFIHADLDAFYASVEQFDHPEYCGKPVIIGGLPTDRRSVVSTASYEARKFGVHSAMPTAQAYKLCPHGIFLHGNMKRYKEKSNEVMLVLENFSPDIQQISIDEAFIDITGTERLFGPYSETGKKLQTQVFEKTGLTISLGLASNKYIAKIASGMSKPKGITIIDPGNEKDFMLSLPVTKIWGAGAKTQETFKKYNFKTCIDIYNVSLEKLILIFGESFGHFLYRAVRGEAAHSFGERATHSISAERTFEYDLTDCFEIETVILDICQTLMWRLLNSNLESKTICIKIRYGDFSTESARETLSRPVRTMNDLFDYVCALFHNKYKKGEPVRLIGAALMNIDDKNNQSELFDFEDEKERRLEKCILEINKKFPNNIIKKGRTLLK
jgi:DNA polymerase-4